LVPQGRKDYGQMRRRRKAPLTFSVLVVANCYAACGGATQSDLFTGSGGANDAGVGLDSGVDARVDGSRQDSSTDSAPPVLDAPPPAPDSAPDAIPPPPPPVIVCGAASCVAGTQTCCAEHTLGSLKAECKDLTKCTGTGKFAISCDGDDDCQVIKKDSVCCVTFSQTTGLASGASCYQAKDCASNWTRTRTCDPHAATNVCDSGDVCRVSTHTLPGYFLCLPPI
jgi:hypothetical protein